MTHTHGSRPVEIESDIQSLLNMGRDMYEESIFTCLDYSPERVIELFNTASAFEEFCFFVSFNRYRYDLTGFFIGRATEHIFTYDRYAIDLLFYVKPEFRGTTAASNLIENYKDWCIDSNIKLPMIGTSTGVDLDRTKSFYEKSGFKCVGYNFIGA